jgi:hypothetical protein
MLILVLPLYFIETKKTTMIEKLLFKLDKQYKNEAEFTSRFGREIKKRS